MLSSAFRGATRRSLNLSRQKAHLPQRIPLLSRTLITKKYTKDHELITFDDATRIGTISITDYAQSSLGDVVFVELPSEGTKVSQGDQIGAVESLPSTSLPEQYTPVSGIVKEINEVLNDQPGLINKSPEEKAWLCKIELSNPSEMESLLDAESYKAHCEH